MPILYKHFFIYINIYNIHAVKFLYIIVISKFLKIAMVVNCYHPYVFMLIL